MKTFDLSEPTATALADFRRSVQEHGSRGGCWRCGGYTCALTVDDSSGRVVVNGKTYLGDMLDDRRNRHLRGVWEAIA